MVSLGTDNKNSHGEETVKDEAKRSQIVYNIVKHANEKHTHLGKKDYWGRKLLRFNLCDMSNRKIKTKTEEYFVGG